MAVKRYNGSGWDTVAGVGAQGATGATGASATTVVTTKGDLLTYDTTAARLGVGANGTVLTADSTAATGIKWAKSPDFVGCSLYNSVAQSIANNTLVALTFDNENFDTDSFHSTVSNTSRITIPATMAGKYLINGTMRFATAASGIKRLKLYKNGAEITDFAEESNNASVNQMQSKSVILNLNVSDYIELFVFQNSGGALNFFGRDIEQPFSIQYLGA